MVTRDTAWPEGTPSWVDLGSDVEKARAFYSGLFGWDIAPGDDVYGGYTMGLVDGRPVAGFAPKQSPDMPAMWTTYLAVDDADKTAAAITAAGGALLMEPMDVGDVGRMAVATDPAGAVFGIWQAGTHTGVSRVNEPGALAWNEHMSRDFEGSKKFYAAVFGYRFDDMSAEGFHYATLNLDSGPVGGIGVYNDDVPASMPAAWGNYFAVENTDASVAKVTELGGSVIRPAQDSPHGRLATVVDDQGAMFTVIQMMAEA